MKIKQLVQVKLGEAMGLNEGEFTAYASVFGNVDSYGDIVMPGAFAESLVAWAAKDGAVIPLLFGHRMDDPEFNIGHVDAVEDDHGLLVHGYLDLESPKGLATYRALKSGRLSQMSFAYDVLEGHMAKREDRDVYEIHKLDLFEVSVVTVGGNQETEILAVKSTVEALVDGVKAGRVLSAKNEETLRDVVSSVDAVAASLKSVLSQLGAGEDQEKAGEEVPVKAEEPETVKAEEPARSKSAQALAINQFIQAL